MKFYSEEELKKRLGHSITLKLLEEMFSVEHLECAECPYFIKETQICKLKSVSVLPEWSCYQV